MKKDFFKKLVFFIVSSCIFVSGCSFSGDDDNTALKAAVILAANNSSSSEKVRVNLNFDTPRGGTLLPSQELTDLTFDANKVEGSGHKTVTAPTKEQLCSKEIWLQTGTWDFTLSGFIDGVEFKGELKNFELAKNNASLSFNLTPDGISDGALHLVLNFSGDADYAELKVTDTETNASAASKTYRFNAETGSNEKKKIEYSKTFKGQNSEGLTPGTYLITVDFYRDGMKTGDLPLNTWKAYARIKAGLTAATEVEDFDLTDSYTITYHNVDNTALATSGVAVACFSRKSGTITLPVYTNAAGFNVLCWYETENFDISTSGITEFESKNNLRNMNFYPLWDTDTAHVANGGTGNGLTAANPASSVTAALTTLQKLHAYGSAQTDLTVQISGEVTGNTTIGTSLDSFADSLTLCGKDGNETDILYGAGSGSVITVQSTKPVTVKNLQIKGGRGVSNGGGIYIGGTSSVILEDGALININTATKTGGGIYVSKNTGTAGRTSLTINAGAKITKNEVSSNNPEYGGMGIFAESAKIVMNGGEISQNNGKSLDQRGAIRLHDGCVFELNDGIITNNSAYHIAGNIFCRASTINMKGGEISSGKASTKHSGGGGGGLWIEKASSFNMTGGVFLNNTAEKGSGGAVYIDGRNSEGVGPVFSMSGTAYIPSATKQSRDNDIYYQKNSDGNTYPAIEISGALTPNASDVQKGAIALSPRDWKRRQVVLKAAATAPSGLDIEDYEAYFCFTSSGSFLSYGDNTAIIMAPYYVSDADNASDEETVSGDSENPYKTLNYAVGKLSGGYDEIIYINGTIKSASEIPDEFTTTKCKSLTIIGANGLDAQGNPKDVLTLADDAESGSVLTINSQVPVTLKNIKITGGKGTPGLDNTEYTTGGGIHTGENATLKLADGVLITGNTATLSGGGIYLGNNSDLYMYGSSYVGDKQTRLAVHDSSEDNYDFANAAGNGGGIYNSGNVYLGYSGKDSSGNLIPADWTGGICRNCAGKGGGIVSSSSSTVKMRTGKISYNSAKYSKSGYMAYDQIGGGIYSYAMSSSTNNVEISGGEISHNAAKDGGGIYITDNGAVLKFTGGKMEANSADENGGAINYTNGKIEVSGSVYIPCAGEKQNDVYLAESKFITVTGNLSLPADAPDNAKNVKITPSAWNRGAQVLGAATAALIADNKGHFATIDEDFTVDQKSGETTKGVLSAPIYVASYGYDDTRYGNPGYTLSDGARGTRTKPYRSLSTALEAADASSHIIYIDGTFTGKTEITSESLPNTDMLTLRGYIPEGKTVAKATLNGDFSSFGNGNTTLIINGKTVDIYDLTIKGGNNKSSNYGDSATPGGGILITGSADVTLNSGTIITDNTACYGGGVSVFKGKLTVNNGAVVRKNTAKKDSSSGGYGGGIYVGKNGFLSLAGGMIGDSTLTANGNNAMRGGGIYADYNDEAPDVMRLEMTGGSVSHNLREVDGTYKEAGAGLYICGKARISGGVIDYNTTAGNAPKGGGIYLDLHSVCTISGDVEISNNSAYYGAGIYSYTPDLTVEGGIFRDNNANTSGGAIYADRTLKLKGNPVFWQTGDAIEKNQNDISLSSYNSIEITGPVTSTAAYVAAVTPTYKRGERLLLASSENIENMDNAISKFVLTEDNDGWNREKIEPSWDSSMRLYIINSPIYVVDATDSGNTRPTGFNKGVTTDATGTKAKPYASIAAAAQASDLAETDGKITIAGTLTGAQTISTVTSGVTAVTLQGYKTSSTAASSAQISGGGTATALSLSKSGLTTTITDLTITNGKATDGAGINISAGTVKLADNAKVTGNIATGNGGGVYVASGASLFMYGKALIGDSTTSTTPAANGTSAGSTTFANKAASGAGIYSEGSVYLGYSAWSGSSGTAEPLDTGYGVRRNFATGDYAGIYGIGTGTVRIKTGYVSYNAASSNGGGLGGNFILEGGTVSGNKASNGAGVYIPNGVTTSSITSGTVSSNIASTNGGAAYIVNGGKLTLSDGTISANEAVNGGGVFTYNYSSTSFGTFEMSGGTLTGNKATGTSGKGGAIYNTGTVTMTAGTIGASGSLNTATGTSGQGGAIYQNGTFNMSGSAVVYTGTGVTEKYNDVYLADNTKYITVDGPITGTGTVASVTPYTWKRGNQVLAPGGSVSSLPVTWTSRFGVTDSEWSVISNASIISGTSTLVGKIDAELWVAGTDYDSSNSVCATKTANDNNLGTKKQPYATIKRAAEECWTTDRDFTINVSGMITGTTQTIPAEDTTNNKTLAKKIILQGSRGNSYDGINRGLASSSAVAGGSALIINYQGYVDITNLKIMGGNTTGNGGGIQINGSTSLIGTRTSSRVNLKDGVLIQQNQAVNGGGVYSSCAILCLSGTATIGSNATTPSRSTASTALSTGINKATTSGGGIYSTSSYLYFGGAWVSGTIASSGYTLTKGVYGNVCTVDSSATDANQKKGVGGVYNYGCFYFMSGNINCNYGIMTGGVYNNYSTSYGFSMLGGSIHKNTGWGVYNDTSGEFSMSGDSYIGDNAPSSVATSATDCSNSKGGLQNKGTAKLGYKYGSKEKLNGGIYRNYGTSGVGVNNSGTLYFDSGTIAYNKAANNGSGIYSTGTVYMTGSSSTQCSNITNNFANNGGGIYLSGTNAKLFMTGYAVIGNSGKSAPPTGTTADGKNYATQNGGGVYAESGVNIYLGYSKWTDGGTSDQATLNGGIYYNYAGRDGGGIYCNGYVSAVTIYMMTGNINANIATNSSTDYGMGGGIWANYNCNIHMGGGTINKNKASRFGGGVYLKNDANIFMYGTALIGDTGSTLATTSSYGNTAISGAGVYAIGEGSFHPAVYLGSAGEGSGGISNDDFNSNYGIRRNYASGASSDIEYEVSGVAPGTGFGGGVYCKEALFYARSGTVGYNLAAKGGGVAVFGGYESYPYALGLNNNATNSPKIIGNKATVDGGGLYIKRQEFCVEGTIESNVATYNGGGIYNNIGHIKISTDNGIINLNQARQGGGIYSADGTSDANTGNIEMSAGKITNNQATWEGGGVYENNYNDYFSMEGGTLAGNYAGNAGGAVSGKLNIKGFISIPTTSGHIGEAKYNDIYCDGSNTTRAIDFIGTSSDVTITESIYITIGSAFNPNWSVVGTGSETIANYTMYLQTDSSYFYSTKQINNKGMLVNKN